MSDLIKQADSPKKLEKLQLILDKFVCTLDPDIEHFLKEKSIEFSNRKLANTFLIVDEDKVKDEGYIIEGYFALATRALSCRRLSKTQAKKLGSGKAHEAVPTILIAQLGKYISNERKSQLNIKSIFSLIDDVVTASLEYIPNKVLLVECNDEVFEQGLYQSMGFKPIQQDQEDKLHQLYKLI